jgi:hypothetical protein
MEPRTIHKIGRLLSVVLIIAGAVIGSLLGLGASMWGGLFVIVPVVTAIFTIAGMFLGAALRLAIAMRWPEGLD